MPEPVASPFDFETEASDEFDTPIEPEAKPQEGAAEPKVGEVAPKTAASGKDAAPVQKHGKLTLHFANEFGFSEKEIAEMSPEELEAEVRAVHRQMLRTSKEFRRNEDRPAAPAPPASQAGAKPGEVEKPAEPDELAEFDDVVAPQVLAAIKKGREADKKRLEALSAKVEEYEGEKRQAAIAKFFDAVDDEFGKMPAGVKAVIGDGHRSKASRVQKAVRKEILTLAEADDSEASWQEKLRRATREVVGDEAFAEREVEAEPEPAPKPVPAKGPDGRFASKPQEEREKEWKTAGAAKPTQRESPLPKGDERAMKAVAKFLPDLQFDTNLDDFPA